MKSFTRTSYLKMAYEKVLFPVVFFSKKRYCGLKHEKVALIQRGTEKLSISGFQIKKKGNAAVLSSIGEALVRSVLHPVLSSTISDMVRSTLSKQFMVTAENLD